MEMLQYDFMQRAVIACLAMALFTPILGLFLILRKQSLMADTLAHISLAGVALGYLLGLEPTLTTIALVILAAMLLEYLRRVYSNYSDISIAMLMSGGMALALLLLSRVDSAASIESYLFGSIVAISPLQIGLLIGLAVLVGLAYLVNQRILYVLSFDEDTAYTAGLPTRLISVLFSVVTGVAISIMMPIAGSLLVSAIIIMPAAIAMRIARHFNQVIYLAICLALVGMLGGLTVSYHFDTPPGATIAALFILIFMVQSLYLKIKS